MVGDQRQYRPGAFVLDPKIHLYVEQQTTLTARAQVSQTTCSYRESDGRISAKNIFPCTSTKYRSFTCLCQATTSMAQTGLNNLSAESFKSHTHNGYTTTCLSTISNRDTCTTRDQKNYSKKTVSSWSLLQRTSLQVANFY
jgi:hypothetical protein